MSVLNFLGFKRTPSSPEYSLNTDTIVRMEAELIGIVAGIFGPNHLNTQFSEANPPSRAIDLIAEIMEHIRFLLECIEENNIYAEIPNYTGPYYTNEDLKAEEYKIVVTQQSMYQLSRIFFQFLIKDSRRNGIDYSQPYFTALEVLNNYSIQMNLGSYMLEETLEA